MAIIILLLIALAVVGGFVGWFVWSAAVIGVVVLLALWLVGVFNSLGSARNRVKEAWSDIDVQLKRRYDLIPNLIETVKG